jgi:hypothetical protein
MFQSNLVNTFMGDAGIFQGIYSQVGNIFRKGILSTHPQSFSQSPNKEFNRLKDHKIWVTEV